MYTMSGKRFHSIFASNFVKFWPWLASIMLATCGTNPEPKQTSKQDWAVIAWIFLSNCFEWLSLAWKFASLSFGLVRFLSTDVSQVSVVMHLRCDGVFNYLVEWLTQSCCFTACLQCQCSLPGLAWLMTSRRYGSWRQPQVTSMICEPRARAQL